MFNMKTSQSFVTPEPTYDIQLTQSAPIFEEEFLGVFYDLTDPNEATEEDNTRMMPSPSVKEIESDIWMTVGKGALAELEGVDV